MVFKLNIRPDLEAEIEQLLSRSHARSKTEYINRAIENYNQQLKRELSLRQLKDYFKSYQKEGKEILRDFAKLKSNSC